MGERKHSSKSVCVTVKARGGTEEEDLSHYVHTYSSPWSIYCPQHDQSLGERCGGDCQSHQGQGAHTKTVSVESQWLKE